MTKNRKVLEFRLYPDLKKRRTEMRRFILSFALLLLVFALVVPAFAADKEDIEALIDQYLKTNDSGDLKTQATLMAADRVWLVTGPGRRLDQSQNMAIQEASQQPDSGEVKTISEARDLVIRFYGDNDSVAVASFYWYINVIFRSGAPEGFTPPTPLLVTHVLEKDGGSWKITHTHASPMYITDD
jgi:uncharacterized protein (TIGR02246 family)